MKKILLICSDSNTVINFRKELISFLQNKSYEIYVLAGDSQREDDIKKLDVKFICVPFSNRDKSIASSLKLMKSFERVMKKIEPDIVFTFQIKPNIFGCLAAKKVLCKNMFCMIEGLGDPFQPTNFKGKLLRLLVVMLYKYSLKWAKKVFVLNHDDKGELIKRKIIKDNKLVLVPGIGIDTSSYRPSYSYDKGKIVTNFSRLIKNKGIIEYCEIARNVRKIRPDIVFKLYGSESQLTKKDIAEYIQDGSIEYEGYTNDVKDAILDSTFVVSTSYREGFSRVLLEAMALGRPVVASNVIGNREIVADGETGFLCDLNNLQSFADCIINNIDNRDKIVAMGKKSRFICEKNYDSSIINKTLLDIVESNIVE